jgi:adenine-specific DNA-methyltransferase
MTEIEAKIKIKSSIDSFAKGNLSANGINLFKSLGYNTERQTSLGKPNYKEFEESYVNDNLRFKKDKAAVEEWKYVDVLFQLSKGEVLNQKSLFDTGRVDDKIIESYLFVSIELSKKNYSRTELSSITREVNKLFVMPVMVLFKYDNLLTLSIINRRLHKRDDSKDVLQKVTLIKDINIEETNRAHIEILYDLSFEELNRRYNFRNFVELDEAWQDTLDTKELNNKFFEKISNWFYWAATKVKFKDKNFHSEVTEDNANYLIKIISRLIFIYFLKERKLIPEILFYKDKIFPLIDKNEPNESSYYKAILQNLFFGILNTPISNGRFKKLRNKNYLSDEAAIEKLLAEIPFVNGGLFDIGDEPYSNSENILTVSDDLFFGKEREIDLSKFFPQRNKAKVEGIINILNHYKFTIEENTPIEEEIALDPELLGKVFENLLAAINPQTGTTVRKSTGSYYTPREVVDYMVTKSLTLYLKSKIETDKKHKWTEENIETNIHDLLSYGFENPFNASEAERIIIFLDELKILDPACGSGAFPMGLLNKIVFALNKLDPEAKRWLELLLDKIPNSTVRKEVKHKLEKENWNYIRKLGIIQDTIYGIDILPFAVQISKLRFYISLIVDQKVDNKKENKGIIPLPNLEFKLVCSNSLIPLSEENKQGSIFHDNTANIEELKQVRDEYFRSNGDEKEEAIKHFKKIQTRIMNEATKGISKGVSVKNNRDFELASWNPFSDNKTEWFDMQWMFGIEKGFSIVIGNPPYIGQKGNNEIFKEVKDSLLGEFHQRRMDYFYFFFHQSINLAAEKGVINFITTNYYITATGADILRKDIKERTSVRELINFNELKIFESALGQHNLITFLTKDKDNHPVKVISSQKRGFADAKTLKKILLDTDEETTYFEMPNQNIFEGNTNYIRLQNETSKKHGIDSILEIVKNQGKPLKEICHIAQGIVTSADKVSNRHLEKFKLDAKKGDGIYILSPKELREKGINETSNHLKPWFKNSDIKKYWTNSSIKEFVLYFKDQKAKQPIEKEIFKHFEKLKELLTARLTVCRKNKFQWNIVSKWIDRGEYYLLFYPRRQEFFESPKIVCPQRSSLNTFGYSEGPWYAASDVYFIIQKDTKVKLKYVLALLNSKLFYSWLYHKGKRKGETLELVSSPLSEIPIRIADKATQDIFEIVSDYIIECKSQRAKGGLVNSLVDSFFESLNNLLVYELYFEDEISNAGLSVMSSLKNLKSISELKSSNEKMEIIQAEYERLNSKEHTVKNALFNMDTIQLIKIIEGK